MNIRERILILMKEQNISKADLYRMVEKDLKRSTFYNIFDKKTNLSNITLDTIRPIKNALNTTLDYLITGEEDCKSNKNNIITLFESGERIEYELSNEDRNTLKYLLVRLAKNITRVEYIQNNSNEVKDA